jgi:hypothetical protein
MAVFDAGDCVKRCLVWCRGGKSCKSSVEGKGFKGQEVGGARISTDVPFVSCWGGATGGDQDNQTPVDAPPNCHGGMASGVVCAGASVTKTLSSPSNQGHICQQPYCQHPSVVPFP